MVFVHAQLYPTLCNPWTVAVQAPLFMEFSRREYWNRLPFPTPGGLPSPGIASMCLLQWQADGLPWFTEAMLLNGDKWKNIAEKRCNHKQNCHNVFVENYPGGSEVKASACNAGDMGSIPGLGRSPGVGNGNLFQYSCLENFMGRRTWQAIVHGVVKSQTWLTNWAHRHN